MKSTLCWLVILLALLLLLLLSRYAPANEPPPPPQRPAPLYLMSAPPDTGTAGRVSAGLLALYTFAGNGATVADSAPGTALELVIANTNAVAWLPGGGLRILAPTMIRSAGAADRLAAAIVRSQALTVEVWLRPANSVQGGPARIVALSANGMAGANFMLGQGGGRFEFRLRTAASDSLGRPAAVTPAATVRAVLTHLVASRDDEGRVRLYLDALPVTHVSRASPLWGWGNYPLALANEPALDETGRDRPWLGELYLVAVYDRALSGAEVRQNFAAGLP